YTVTVTDGNNCSATSAATTVMVNPLPATPTITPGGPTTFCTGGSVTLTSSSGTGNQWKLNGSPIGCATSQSHLASAAGHSTVTATLNGCSEAKSANVNVISAVTVTSITPATGSTFGGQPVTIGGTGFVSGATVTIGGSAATNVVFVNSTTIKAKTPAHAGGT